MSDWKEQDLKQSHSAKSKIIQEQSLENIGLTRQSIMTSGNSQESNSDQMELFQTLSVEATPVSRCQSQESNSEKKMKDISFQRCLDLYEASGQNGVFSKMLADTLNSVTTTLPHRWKMKATPSGRLLFQLAPLMRRTGEIGSGLWRTPETSQGGKVSDEVLQEMANGDMKRKSGQLRQLRLQDQVRHPKLWPTPTTQSNAQVAGQYSKTNGTTLAGAVRTSETDGQLNPTWVEWLMGYDIGHTELKDLATRSFRKSQKSSDKS